MGNLFSPFRFSPKKNQMEMPREGEPLPAQFTPAHLDLKRRAQARLSPGTYIWLRGRSWPRLYLESHHGPRVWYGKPVCAGRRHTCAADQSRFSAGNYEEKAFQARGAAWGKKPGVLGDEVSGVDDWVNLIFKETPL